MPSAMVSTGSLRRRGVIGGGGGSSEEISSLIAGVGCMVSSVMAWSISLVTKGVNGKQSGCPARGIQTEEQTGRDRDTEREKYRVRRHLRMDTEHGESASADAGEDAEQAAERRQQHGFDDKLRHDIGSLGADRLANADFSCPLRN